MKIRKKIKLLFLFIIYCSISFIGLCLFLKPTNGKTYEYYPNLAQSQYDNNTYIVSSSIEMLEYGKEFKIQENVNSFNLTLPSVSWNITDVELNFSSIKLGKEIKTIENIVDRRKIVSWETEEAWAVQINITEPTIIYGVYLYGQRVGQLNDNVFIQIRGFEGDPIYIPNNKIYVSQKLNMDLYEDWYVQMFSNPISLPVGFYSLILNGTMLTKDDDTKYYWYNNEIGPWLNPYLHISKYSGVSWSDEEIQKTFLYKLIQGVNRSYYPEDINMTVRFDKVDYIVSNGLEPYTGHMEIENKNYSPNNYFFNMPFNNNNSIELMVNLSYYIALKSPLISNSTIIIQENFDNFWIFNPQITKNFVNTSILFNIPENWYNITIFRNNINITLDPNVIIEEDFIFINNNSIIDNSEWKITTNSPKINFSLDVPKTYFESAQELAFAINPPNFKGNLTIVLYDALGFIKHIEIIENAIDPTIFSYDIPSNPNAGEWTACVYWNNNTAAGSQYQIFDITNPSSTLLIENDDDNENISNSSFDPFILILTVLITLISTILGISSYQIGKKVKKIESARKQRVVNRFLDVLNLSYIIIAEKDTGVNVYQEELASNKIDAALISGFLEAIRTFGIELSGSQEQSQAIKLDYQSMKIIMSDFKNFRLISIMKDNPSREFFEALEPLSYDIEKYYGNSLKNFNGEISQFEGIKDLIEKHLQISLIYPLSVVIDENSKLNIKEKTFVNKASEIMKQKSSDYFFVSTLLSEVNFNIKNGEMIIKLIKKGIFKPIKL